jgi:carbonic anhydrase
LFFLELLLIMVRFSVLAVAVLSVAVPASATGGNYSYDQEHPLGPDDWETLELEGNQCGGNAQSPIAIESFECSEYADYKLTVSNLLFSFPFARLRTTRQTFSDLRDPSN